MVINWELVGKIKASSYRLKVLNALKEREKIPTELSKELNIKISHISRALSELEGLELVECLNPELRKGKIYSVTKKGREVVRNVINKNFLTSHT